MNTFYRCFHEAFVKNFIEELSYFDTIFKIHFKIYFITKLNDHKLYASKMAATLILHKIWKCQISPSLLFSQELVKNFTKKGRYFNKHFQN